MIRNIILSMICCSFCVGCNTYSSEFVQVIQNHRVVTVDTCDSIIKSIDDELKSTLLSEEDRVGLSNLRKRLSYMKKSSTVIERYILNEGDEDLIRQLLKDAWHD